MCSGGKPCGQSSIIHTQVLRSCGPLCCCIVASVEGPGTHMAIGDDPSPKVVCE